AIYGARDTALSIEHDLVSPEENVFIAGRYCDSGDLIIDNIMLQSLKEEDLLLIPVTGAYCLPMGSNYNLVPRPAVLLADERQVQVMERRETYDDVLARYQGFKGQVV